MRNSRKNDNGTKNIIGEKIRYYREINNYTYSSLSDNLMLLGIDIPLQSIYKIEKGKRTVVDYEICGFAKCFNVTPNELLLDYTNSL